MFFTLHRDYWFIGTRGKIIRSHRFKIAPYSLWLSKSRNGIQRFPFSTRRCNHFWELSSMKRSYAALIFCSTYFPIRSLSDMSRNPMRWSGFRFSSSHNTTRSCLAFHIQHLIQKYVKGNVVRVKWNFSLAVILISNFALYKHPSNGCL